MRCKIGNDKSIRSVTKIELNLTLLHCHQCPFLTVSKMCIWMGQSFHRGAFTLCYCLLHYLLQEQLKLFIQLLLGQSVRHDYFNSISTGEYYQLPKDKKEFDENDGSWTSPHLLEMSFFLCLIRLECLKRCIMKH